MQRADDDGRVRCLLGLRFSDDGEAAAAALALYDASGNVVGLNRAQTMDGGWRGMLQLVPEVPVGKHRRYLDWLLSASQDFNGFFGTLGERAPSGLRYRWQPIEIRFFRSVGRTTPSAYATDWAIAFNVSGSLHKSRDAVRETMFHEIFHLNDADHGGWSARVLSGLYADLLARCGRKTACLTPYAPSKTMVRGGTYYAFHEEHVAEYAAELATRYFTEQSAVLAGGAPKQPAFKCGPPENRQAWDALVKDFFGVDLVPDCP